MAVPEKPALEGLEAKWTARWEESGTYRFDRSRSRDDVYSIDTPPPTVSGSLHVGHVYSYTHTDLVARFHRMRGKAVFYPMGWDDNGLPTERRVQNYYGVRCDPSLPYDPAFRPPEKPDKHPISVSRPNFMFLAIDCRMRGSFWVVPISALAASSGFGTLEPAALGAEGAGAAAAGAAAGAAAADAAALAASAAATTSSRRIRPPTPVPFSEDRSTPLSAASLRITGVT